MTSAPEVESRLPVGSSASRMGGCAAIARAMATRCCWPPDLSAVPHPVAQAYALKAFPRGPAAFLAADAAVDQRKLDIFQRGKAGNEVEALENKADLPVAYGGKLMVRQGGYIAAFENIGAVGRRVQAAEQVHQGGFSRARLADDSDKFPFVNGQRNVRQGPDFVFAGMIDFADMLKPNDLFHCAHTPSCIACPSLSISSPLLCREDHRGAAPNPVQELSWKKVLENLKEP